MTFILYDFIKFQNRKNTVFRWITKENVKEITNEIRLKTTSGVFSWINLGKHNKPRFSANTKNVW